MKGLQKLQAEIADITARLKKEQSLRTKKATRAAFRMGIFDGIDDFVSAQLPFYKDLTPGGIDKRSTKMLTLVDSALRHLSFAAEPRCIARDLGTVVKDPDSFRHAGKRVFGKAQYRMELIARTEVMRAHNQGRIKFHEEVGVSKLEWMTMDDERTCPVCGPLDGKAFPALAFLLPDSP